MKHIILFVCFTSVVLMSCQHIMKDKVKGNGNIKTENRNAGVFSSVDVSGSIDLYVKQDSVNSVKVEADENLLQYIVIRTEGTRLIVEPKEGYSLSGSKHIKVYVSSPFYKNLEASGACNIIGENKIVSTETIDIDLSGASDIELEIKAPNVEAELSGAGSVSLKGETKDFSVNGSGSSDINCVGLMAENVSVHISGAGNAEVFASVKLDVSVSGAGSVKYKGNAAVNKSISGAGSVTKIE